MRGLVLLSALLLLTCVSVSHSSVGEADGVEDSGERGARPDSGNGEEDEGDGTFLDPYYEAEEDTSGCWLSGCFDVVELPRFLTMVEVSYNPDPFRRANARNLFGSDGNPLAFSMDLGVSKQGEERGYTVQALLLTPTPFGIEGLLHRVRPGGGDPDFTLLYAGIPVQLIYGTPVQVMLEPQLVFPREDHRWTLTGQGIGLISEMLFLDGGGVSADYRLTWINGLPMHRGEGRLSWYSVPLELWAGYTLLRNCRGETIQGPCAGIGLIL